MPSFVLLNQNTTFVKTLLHLDQWITSWQMLNFELFCSILTWIGTKYAKFKNLV